MLDILSLVEWRIEPDSTRHAHDKDTGVRLGTVVNNGQWFTAQNPTRVYQGKHATIREGQHELVKWLISQQGTPCY